MLTHKQPHEARRSRDIAHVTSQAENRMRTRTAKEAYESSLAALNRERDDVIPDGEDDSALRNNVLR